MLLGLAVASLLAGRSTEAANLLANPSFESPPNGNTIPTGWNRFSPPTTRKDYWVENLPAVAHSGTYYWKQWDATYSGTNVAGIYEDFSTSPGSTFQASGWFYTYSGDAGGLGSGQFTWVEVSFLGSSNNVLALYKSDNFDATSGTDIWVQGQVTQACDVSSPISSGDPYFTTYAVTGSVSQLVAPPGATTVRYRYAYLAIDPGTGSAYFDDAVLDQTSGASPPVLSNVFPQNMIFVNPNDGISFNVSSPSGFTINSNAIGLVLNGVDVSSNLAISGSSSNKTVTYHGLQSNTVYSATITATDVFNLTVSASTHFETTWVGVPPVLTLWEAEDFDFTNGMYYDFPTLCDTIGNPNCYFGTVGNPFVDEYPLGNAPTHLYRPDDLVGTVGSGDFLRKDHVLAGVQDYRIDPFNSGQWINYTRDWSNGTYWVIGRLSTDVGLSGTFTLSLVNPDNSTTDLGTFTINGGLGWTTFENVYLKDTNGNNALVTLNGKQTLRLTASGPDLRPNFFMLVAPQLEVTSIYPTGKRPFESTNSFAFTISSFSGALPANAITLNLDVNDVSSNLVITGSSSTRNVVYPYLMPNAVHVAVIAATNLAGQGLLMTNRFDTFSEGNYMVEAEDFDYDGGQFISADNWFPGAYADAFGPYPAVTNIDYQHISSINDVFNYRTNYPVGAGGIPQDKLGSHDYVRTNWVNNGAPDYVLVFFANTDWANYTRQYPTGSYYFYIRSSGDGPYSLYLDQIISGAGTTNQVTKRLGHFGGFGRSPAYFTYDWVPLTDDGLSAPAAVKLNGLATLRITTAGNCNPNYFMLVPAGGIKVSVRAASGNTLLSFPTQVGATYRVFYRTNLDTGNWSPLTTLIGNGAVKTVSDPTTGGRRFYKVTAP